MPAQLRISVRFLDGAFHGRGDGGEPEWPPSPLRLFQAIVAAAATGWTDRARSEKDDAALNWLERQPPPTIVAASRAAIQPQGYKLYVPDNVGDLVAKKWEKGMTEESIAGYRTDKFVRPTLLDAGDNAKNGEFPAVHYIWSKIVGEQDVATLEEISESLVAAARSVSRLGWGIDHVVTDAIVEEAAETTAAFPGERWLPVETVGGTSLRVPLDGTLTDLKEHHAAFLGRINHLEGEREVFVPVPPITAFRVVTYRRDSELTHQPFAVFALRKLDDSGFAAFDTQWRRLHLTGMLRHAASQFDFATTLGWTSEKVSSFVLGHDPADNTNPNPPAKSDRLVFIPLPSIEWRGSNNSNTIGAIRRVLVTVSGESGYDPAEFSRIVRTLEGCELIDEKTREPVAFLRRQSDSDRAISSYFDRAATWTTVTPVVLPGYDDPRKLRRRLSDSKTPVSSAEKAEIVRRLDNRIERLLRKALGEAGLPESLVANANLEWRGSGFFPGADLSSRYSAPDQCRHYRRLHVRVSWRELGSDGVLHSKKVNGPFCIGSGRFAGLGLFVPVG